MKTTPPIVEPSTGQEQPYLNGTARSDWLDNPEEAMMRECGPYTFDSADRYLDEESVELYNGWLVLQEMTDVKERTVIGTIQDLLSLPARSAGFGQIVPDQLECLIDNRSVIKPDVSLISWKRLREHVQPYGPRDRPTLMMCPELVIEVRSPSNWRAQEARKRAMYFAQGTEIVWDVDEKNQVIYVYRANSPDQPERFGIDDEIECKPILPNWRRRVADIFSEEAPAEAMIGDLVAEWQEEGRVEGRAEGVELGKREIAQSMLSEGMDVATVVRLTGLTAEQVQSIQSK